MDVTPIVEVLQEIPAGPTINVTFNVDPTIEGDLELISFDDVNMPLGRDALSFGDLNAPFGKDFLDLSEHNDHSTNTTTNRNVEDADSESLPAAVAAGSAVDSPSIA